MATRLYPEPLNTADISTTPSSEWDFQTSPSVRRLSRVRLDAPSTLLQATDSVATSNRDILLGQFISPPLQAQTISGTFKGQFFANETSLAYNLRAQVLVRVVSNDGSVERGVLYAGDLETLTGDPANEFAQSAFTNRKFPRGGAAALSSVAVQDGDRLVVELGARKHSTTTIAVYLRLATDQATEAPEDETTTDYAANSTWVEFSQDILFKPSTKFYLGSTTSPLPALAFDSEWEFTTSAVRRGMPTAPSGLTASNVTPVDSTATSNRDTLTHQFVSDPIAAGPIANASFRAVLKSSETNAAYNLRSQVLVKVVSNDGSVTRGYLYSGDQETLTGNPTQEWTTTATGRLYPRAAPVALSTVFAQTNDRIVVEVGWRKHVAGTSQGTVGALDNGGVEYDTSDAATSTTAMTWCEFTGIDLFTPRPMGGARAYTLE